MYNSPKISKLKIYVKVEPVSREPMVVRGGDGEPIANLEPVAQYINQPPYLPHSHRLAVNEPTPHSNSHHGTFPT